MLKGVEYVTVKDIKSHQSFLSVYMINNDIGRGHSGWLTVTIGHYTYVSIVSEVLLLSSAMVTNVSENEKCVCACVCVSVRVCVLMNRDGALR